uniref:Uncharacterized protein LOC101500153 isoform X1 n=1 Tax=Cicer arietinum TaxID=3827 RepID=A0A1S3DXL2_CICAR|nr:uncharacterized protein LOC101500153 isoform X1 [Cicer arietinum]
MLSYIINTRSLCLHPLIIYLMSLPFLYLHCNLSKQNHSIVAPPLNHHQPEGPTPKTVQESHILVGSTISLMGNKENLQRRNTVYICSRLNGSNGLELWSLKEFFHYVLSPFPPISTSGVQQGFINLFRTFIQELVEFRRRFRCNISRSNGFLEQSSSIADFLRYR